MGIDTSIVPVIMFHSVGLDQTPWIYHHLSESIRQFEKKIMRLQTAGYDFIFWDDLYRHMSGERTLPRPSVMLTFDDGYLDNWVYAFPLLQKYGIKATIFVNPEFVEPASEHRTKHGNGIEIPPEQAMGFLSWEEMRRMEASGLIDIQSHALSHTWYFSGERIIDFHDGSGRYPWLAWNLYPDLKHRYMTCDLSARVTRGYPVFQHEKALVARRFVPEPQLVRQITDFASQQDETFWKQPDWRDVLRSRWEAWAGRAGSSGHLETETEYEDRVRRELSESRRLISENLGKQVDFICWPGGGYNDQVLSIAREVGYKSWTLSSRDRSDYRNVSGADPSRVKRIGSSPHRYAKGRYIGPGTAEYLYQKIRVHQGDSLMTIRHKASQAFFWALKSLTGLPSTK